MMGVAMKAVFFSINLVFGIAGALLGVAAILSAMGSAHSFAVAIVGMCALGLAGVCLCFCGECVLCKYIKSRRPASADFPKLA
jgi:hypothetical protein